MSRQAESSPVQFCPHCGASRAGMNNQQPCWRCKRLPGSAITAVSKRVRPARRRFLWIALLIGALSVAGLIALLLSSVEEQPPPVIVVPPYTPSASPSPTITLSEEVSPEMVVSTPTLAEQNIFPPTPQLAIGSAAQTAAANRPTLPPTKTPTPPASPTPAPSLTLFASRPECYGAPVGRLQLNLNAMVIVDNLLVYTEPSRGNQPFLSLFRETEVGVVGGSVCNENRLWWEVITADGKRGWVIEGEILDNIDVYYLEPR